MADTQRPGWKCRAVNVDSAAIVDMLWVQQVTFINENLIHIEKGMRENMPVSGRKLPKWVDKQLHFQHYTFL